MWQTCKMRLDLLVTINNKTMKIYAKLILEDNSKVWIEKDSHMITKYKSSAHVFRSEKAARAAVQMLDSKVRMKIVAEICENDISTITNSKYGSSHWLNSLIAIIHDAATYPTKTEKYTKQSLRAIAELNENKYLLKYVKQ